MPRQTFHQPQRREVAQDISKAQITTPSVSGGANLPNLRTTPTNRVMESLSGFSETITKLAAVREKNDAAKEALKARNDALAGKFSVFDRGASVDLYDQTRGDIKGRSSALAIQENLTAATSDILNQNLTIQDSLAAFDEAKANIMQENYADHLKQSEAYKSGFLPHIVSTIEKQRTGLAQLHQAKFIAEAKATQSEFASNVAHGVPQTGPDKGVKLEHFEAIRTSGVNLGLKREEATINAIDSIGLIAVEEGKPWLLKFADEVGKDGFKVTNKVALKKKVVEFRSKAQAQFIQGEKLRLAKETRELEAERVAIKQEYYKSVVLNPSEDHSGMLKDISILNKLKGEDLSKMSNFAHNMRSGDRDIAVDNKLEVDTKLKIARGEITKIEELVNIYNQSALSKRGINKSAFDRLSTDLETHQTREGTINNFTTNRDSIKNIFGDDEFIEKNVGGYGQIKREDAKKMQTFSLRSMDQALIYFQAKFPEEPLSGPKAGAFFFNVRASLEKLLEAPSRKRKAQEELSKLKIRFLDNGAIDPQSVEELKEDTSGFFSKEKLEVPENIQEALKIDADDGKVSLLESYNDALSRDREYLKGSEEFINQIRNFVNGKR
jgi:hypothetical protein